MASVAILQYENRPDPVLHQLIKTVKGYAEKHGYSYVLHTKSTEHPPFWQKILTFRDLMNKHGYVAWFDSDVVILEQALPIPELFAEHKGKEFLASYASKKTIGRGVKPQFQAGVFMVKSTPLMKRMVDDWLKSYKKKDWFAVPMPDGKPPVWRTVGPYAGAEYEEGAFNKRIWKNPKYRNAIALLSADVFNGTNPDPAKAPRHAFSLHFTHTLGFNVRKQYLSKTRRLKRSVHGTCKA